jgi:beta-glucosidase
VTRPTSLIARRDVLRWSGSVSLAALMPAAVRAAAADRPLYRDARAPVDLRVRDLIGRMTLDEKVAQLITLSTSKRDVMDANRALDPAMASKAYPNGIGQIARPSDRGGAATANDTGADVTGRWRKPADTIAFVNAGQAWARTTRLGIPILYHEESLHGYMAPEATSFPQAIALAGSFDRDLMTRVQAVIGREVRAHGTVLALSPVVDIARDPRWGRIEETFGEDPYLCGEMGVAAVLGLQGPGKTLAPGQGLRDAEAYDRTWPAAGGQQRRAGTAGRAGAARKLLSAVPCGRGADGDRRGDAVL